MLKKSVLVIILCACLTVLTGCAELPETTQCERCDESVQLKYIFEYENMDLCPKCAYEILEICISPSYRKCLQCGEFFDRIWSYTGVLCEDCEEEWASSCARCGESCCVWNQELDFVLCDQCLSSIFKWKEAQEYVLNDE